MTGPPKLDLTMDDAHAWIEAAEGVTISRQTVYNWTKAGKLGSVLQTKMIAGQRYTRIAWIKEFLDAVNAAS